MYKIATLNKISPVGLNRLSNEYSFVDDPADANGIIVRSQKMHDMEFGKDLLAIARAGAGVNNIPIGKCSEQGIVVFNAPGANANAVKELVMAGLLMSARNIPEAIKWTQGLEKDVMAQAEKGKKQFAGRELEGKVIGVIGLGAIGVMVANTCKNFHMKVIGYDPYINLTSAHALSHKIPVMNDLAAMLPRCDYVTIHVPVNDSTKGMIDSRRIGQMKEGAVLLNFARDGLVNEKALIEALDEGKLSRYVTDFPTDAIANHDRVINTPHLGASTKEAEEHCAIMAAEELMDYLENGNIQNSVNYPTCTMGILDPDAVARVCIMNKNIPTMLNKITTVFSDLNINIRDLTNKSKGDYAYNLVDVDGDIDSEVLDAVFQIEGIIRARIIRNKK
jgi:Phosphoglycerate dehydrogenase and related dehydrogenases